MVGQRAQATTDAELIDTADLTRSEAVRQRQWLDSMLKTLTPQQLANCCALAELATSLRLVA